MCPQLLTSEEGNQARTEENKTIKVQAAIQHTCAIIEDEISTVGRISVLCCIMWEVCGGKDLAKVPGENL